MILQFLIFPVQALITPSPIRLTASTILTYYLQIFLTVWSLAVIVLSAGSILAEQATIADSYLSRSCTRHQFLLARLLSRLLIILAIFLLFSFACGYAVWRYAPNDMTLSRMIVGIAIVGMALMLLTTVGVTFSVILNNAVAAVLLVLLTWNVVGYLFSFFGADYLSPNSLSTNLPFLLKDSDSPRLLSATASSDTITLTFSKELSPETAEHITNYSVESPQGHLHQPQSVAYDEKTFSVLLSGFRLKDGDLVTVTVHNIQDKVGNTISPAANTISTIVGSNRSPSERSQLRLLEVVASPNVVRLFFSRPLDPVKAEDEDNYLLESPLGRQVRPVRVVYNPTWQAVDLRGLNLTQGQPVTVTVRNLTDENDRPLASDARTQTTIVSPRLPRWFRRQQAPSLNLFTGRVRLSNLTVTPTSARLTFSGPLDPQSASSPENYVVESPLGSVQKVSSALYNRTTNTVILTGLQLPSGRPVKVTVTGVVDQQGYPIHPAYNSLIYTEVQNWKYFLGFGLPTLIFIFLSLVAFSYRDL